MAGAAIIYDCEENSFRLEVDDHLVDQLETSPQLIFMAGIMSLIANHDFVSDVCRYMIHNEAAPTLPEVPMQ